MKETSVPMEIKHSQSSVERKIEMSYSRSPTQNPSDCLQRDCTQASCRRWATSWAASLTMSWACMLAYQMPQEEEQGLSPTEVNVKSTSCPVNGEKISWRSATRRWVQCTVRPQHNRSQRGDFTKSEWWRRFFYLRTCRFCTAPCGKSLKSYLL